MFFPYYFDPTLMILLPAIILATYAQVKVQATYSRYSKVRSHRGMTGAEVARAILDRNQLYNVPIEITKGTLTDHYDPRTKVLRLSPDVYHSTSIASIGVAAHEVGHAVQDQIRYAPFNFRMAIVPLANIGSRLSMPFLFIGLLLRNELLVNIGVYAFGLAVLFQLVTLPVEFNASRRAVSALETGGYIGPDEVGPTRNVLRAAALTYVAATLMAALQLIRLMLISGMFGRRRDD
ncbi:MAG: zinc metallopeptidase [Xylanivirga thermophila]|jgi:uncharacterized protein|uniref:zinc metallopeptidase n=1 Tax=Xylanivirga thermophila TaxID=2496273 RepID=UPI00101CC14A|nr:zinc metallopeptidase [Xylanivirga thermophila]